MKTTVNIARITVLVLLTMAFAISSCQKDESTNTLKADKTAKATTTITDIDCGCVISPADTITQAEIDMLVFMREEEKLARDVYAALDELYAPPIFKNIAKSEQWHMDQVLCLLQYYNIPDPASQEAGVFNNSELQQLYNDLVAQGSQSFIKGLKVGATIEDKDIFDLETDMTNTVNPAILTIFDNLACASGNHIRSFTILLTKNGVTYVPQFLSQEEYESIISLPHQFCGAPTATAPSGNGATN
jgi:hypothetical protein